MGLFVEHAAVVRTAVQLALPQAHRLPARHLASLALACGALGNVPRRDMEVPFLFLCHTGSRAPGYRVLAKTLVCKVPPLALCWCVHASAGLQTARECPLLIVLSAGASPEVPHCRRCEIEHSVKQALAGHLEPAATSLRPGQVVVVLLAYSKYAVPVPGLVIALAAAAERQLDAFTCAPCRALKNVPF